MEISLTERMILINQYKILEIIDKDNSDYYKKNQEILKMGIKSLYSSIDESISIDTIDEKVTGFVYKILLIYQYIDDFLLNNLDDTEINSHPLSIFRGFDANNEENYYWFLRFLVDDPERYRFLDKYKEKTDNFNTHGPSIHIYKQMINMYSELGNSLKNRIDILKILKCLE